MSYPISSGFTIQPHPAKDNDPTPNPSGLQDDPEQSGGLRASNPNAMAGAGPVILDNETASNLEQPKSREEVSRLVSLVVVKVRTDTLDSSVAVAQGYCCVSQRLSITSI